MICRLSRIAFPLVLGSTPGRGFTVLYDSSVPDSFLEVSGPDLKQKRRFGADLGVLLDTFGGGARIEPKLVVVDLGLFGSTQPLGSIVGLLHVSGGVAPRQGR